MPEITKNQLKQVRLLKQKKHRQEFGEFVVEGEKNVLELLNSKFVTKTIFATSNWQHFDSYDNVVQITNKQLSQLSNLSTPNQVFAIAKLPEYTFDKTTLNNELTLCLDSINDPGNLGTIIRTADWFGIQNIICSPDSVDCFNPKVVQTSKGSIFNTKVWYQNLETIFSEVNIPIYGAAMDGEKINSSFQIEKPSILLMGSESHGISKDLEKLITQKITISKKGKAESLNVAIATSILLHQFTS